MKDEKLDSLPQFEKDDDWLKKINGIIEKMAVKKPGQDSNENAQKDKSDTEMTKLFFTVSNDFNKDMLELEHANSVS